jgi:hypothetical protein
MAVTLETWSCEGVRCVIRFLWKKRVSPIDICCQLVDVYGDGVMSTKMSDRRAQKSKLRECSFTFSRV